MNNERIPAPKLVILFLFNTLETTLNELQLVSVLTENDWANYFDIKESLAELSEVGMLFRQETPNGIFYQITDSGKESLSHFYKDILHSVRESIIQYCAANRDTLSRERDLFSDYIKLDDDEYRVTLRILDNTKPIFEINLTAYTKEQAETMISNWSEAASVIYKSAYTELIKP